MTILDRWNSKPPAANIKAILPRYCGRCGQTLERVEQSLGFDTNTGRPQFQYWLACPDAPRKDTPYTPSYAISMRARYVTCDLSGWAEDDDVYRYLVSFVSCEPWPKSQTAKKAAS